MITVRIYSYGELQEEKAFKDTDDDIALAWCEEALSDIFADGVTAEVWWKGKKVWQG